MRAESIQGMRESTAPETPARNGLPMWDERQRWSNIPEPAKPPENIHTPAYLRSFLTPLTIYTSMEWVYSDSEWRNMLWDDLGSRLIVIDLEDVKWSKRPRTLEPTSRNARHSHRAKVGKSGQKLLSSSTAICI